MPTSWKRWRVAGLAVALLAVLAVQGVMNDPPSHAEEVTAPPEANGSLRWLTLVTGDKVLLRITGQDEQVVTVRPGKGREGANFLRQTELGDTYVVPADMAPLVAAKRVDRRLFNVSKLVEHGYDDSRRTDVPLIVSYGGGPVGGVAGARRGRPGDPRAAECRR